MNSFSIGQATPRQALLIISLAVIGFASPVLYLIYYLSSGVYEKEVLREFQKIAAWNAKAEADRAIRAGDFALYCVGEPTDHRDPGLGGGVDDDYEREYGRKSLGLYEESAVTKEQSVVIKKAMENLAVYNQLVYREGQKRLGAKAK